MTLPELQHRAVSKRAVRMDKREVDFIASTEAVDAHGTIVKQNWDLRRFSANPVILWAHESDDMPLGRGAASVVNGELLMTVTFATADINPKAEQVLRACEADMVRGMSVGFRPNRVTYDEKNDVFILDENELYEASICPVPSNPEALKRSLRAMATRAKALDTQNDIPQDVPCTPQAPQEIKMDPKLEEMTSKLEARAAEIASLKTNLSALEARAVAAEARVTVLETEHRTASVELTAMKGQNERLVIERDTALERATAAEQIVVRSEVTALVGRKIDGGELEAMIELRTANPAIFQKLMEQRKDMGVLDKALKDEDPGAGPVPGAPPPQPGGASGELYEDFERGLKAADKKG